MVLPRPPSSTRFFAPFRRPRRPQLALEQVARCQTCPRRCHPLRPARWLLLTFPAVIEPKQLYKRIEAVFDGLDPRGTATQFATRMVPRVLDHLGRPLGLTTAHLYERDDSTLRLLKRWGQ